MSQPSSESSDVEPEFGEAAAAGASAELVAHTASLDRAFRSLHLEKVDKVIYQKDWDSKDGPDFRESILAGQYRLGGASSRRDQSESRASDTSSMAMAVSISAYAPSSRLPSLGSYSSAKSVSSVRTSSVVIQNVLDEDEDGVPVAPAPRHSHGRLACCFSFLNCSHRFDEMKEWDTHCKSHLRGKLPKEAHCPFECEWSTRKETGEDAWHRRAVHIVAEHSDDDDVDTKSRPRKSLIDHLWRHRIIDDFEKKDLEMHGRLVNSDYTRSAGSNRDRRRDRPRHR